MTIPGAWLLPTYGSDEWNEFMRGVDPLADPDGPVDEAEDPQVEVQGAADGRAWTGDRLRVWFRRPHPQLDGTGHPVRRVTATLTTTTGVTMEVPLLLIDWDPQHPGDAVYASRPLATAEDPDALLLPLGDGDGFTVRVSTAEFTVDRLHGDRHELAMWRLEQRLTQAGVLLAFMLRTYRQETAGSDSPIVAANIERLTEGVRTAQLGLDHLRDPAPSPDAEAARGRYYLQHLPIEAEHVKALIDGRIIPNPYFEQAQTRLRQGGQDSVLAPYMPEYSMRGTFDSLVKDAETTGKIAYDDKVGSATDALAKDLTLGAYDAVVGDTVWGWAYPLVDLALTGEGRDHTGRELKPGDWAVLGITVATKAAGRVTDVLEVTGRAGGSTFGTATDVGEVLGGELDSGNWAKGQIREAIGGAATDGVGKTVDHAARAMQAGDDSPADATPPPDGPSPDEQVPPDKDATSSPNPLLHPLVLTVGLALLVLIGIGVVVIASGDSTDGSTDEASLGDAPTADAPPGDAAADDSPVVTARPALDLPRVLAILGLDVTGPDGLHRVEDPPGGLSWSRTDAEGVSLPASDIDRTWVLRVRAQQAVLDQLANRSSLPCGAETDEYRVTSAPGATRLDEGEYVLVGVELAGAVGQGAERFTYGLAFDDGDDGDDYQARPPFDADFFDGTESWYRLDVAGDGTREMWADGFVDGVPGRPRLSAGLVVESGDTLLWILPADELPAAPGDGLGYRATAFHDDGPEGAVPDPATSGGDVTGADLDEELVAVDGEPIEWSDPSGLPPDVADHEPRPALDGDPDAYLAAVLFADLEARLTAATASGSEDAVLATVMPELLAGPSGDACRQEVRDTLAQATGVTFTDVPSGPDTTSGIVVYGATVDLVYPTGTVAWAAVAAPGPGGRLFVVLPSCLGTG